MKTAIILITIIVIVLAATHLLFNSRYVREHARKYKMAFDRCQREQDDPRRYALVTWPDCQHLMDREGFDKKSFLVDPKEDDSLDSAYMVETSLFQEGETTGELYIRISWPGAQLYEGEKNTLSDYNGDIFVPVRN